MYEKYFKRIFDIVIAVFAMTLFCWLFAIIALLVKVNLGSPVIFSQSRPGKIDPKSGKERIFMLHKFRTMTNDSDFSGILQPDSKRITRFGSILRETSLDELPEFWNILKGDMSLVGPRPQLVRDMLFMTDEQRTRHKVRPGLTGLAQINGRNSITWESKLNYDIQYLGIVTFLVDFRILLITLIKVFKRENINCDGESTSEDFGDYLLRIGRVSKEMYEVRQQEACDLLREVEIYE